MCDFYFFFQQSDVSTLKQEDNYCRNHLMNELTDSKKHEDRLLTKCRKFEERNRQLTNRHFRKLTIIIADSRSFSQTHDASSENKMQSSFSKRELSFRENSFCCFIHGDSICDFVISRKRIFVSLI